jgi:hypothetical protein
MLEVITNKVAQFLAVAEEAFLADLAKSRRGRKSTRTFAALMSHTNPLAIIGKMFAADPLTGYLAHAVARRPLTAEERNQVAESEETKAHGLLECGEPAQRQLFVSTHIRVAYDDVTGEQFQSEVNRVVKMARTIVQDEPQGTTLYVRYQPNAVTRAFKLAGLRARYGGRLYISDMPEHSGYLLATVTKGQKATLAIN